MVCSWVKKIRVHVRKSFLPPRLQVTRITFPSPINNRRVAAMRSELEIGQYSPEYVLSVSPNR